MCCVCGSNGSVFFVVECAQIDVRVVRRRRHRGAGTTIRSNTHALTEQGLFTFVSHRICSLYVRRCGMSVGSVLASGTNTEKEAFVKLDTSGEQCYLGQ